MNIVLLGAHGQLGSEIAGARYALNARILPFTRSVLDITDFPKMQKTLLKEAPDMVINSAAYTRVDDAETEKEHAFLVNATAVGELAKLCGDMDIPLVHFSTDYVFGGEQDRKTPYTETDQPSPINRYGESKLKGEELIAENCKKYFIIRTSGLYGRNGQNFVKTMIARAKTQGHTKVVDDQITVPTWTHDILDALPDILASREYGIYHVTPNGHTSWFEFAKKIFETANPAHLCIPCASRDYPLPAKRPFYSVLKSAKISPRRSWEESQSAFLQSL